MMDLIAEMIGLPTKGKKLFRNHKASQSTMNKFLKKREKDNLVKLSSNGYAISSIKPFWANVVEAIMR